MRHRRWSSGRVASAWRGKSLLGQPSMALLWAGALCIAGGTALGLANFRDVGFPDSANLLRIQQFVESGRIYFDNNSPPYQVTVYGPLTYALLAIPYRLGQLLGIDPHLAVKIGVAASFLLCEILIFAISKCLYRSLSMAYLCTLLAGSVAAMASWTTQIRGDYLALSFSLTSVYLLLAGQLSRGRTVGAAICAGLALLVKQTFFAAPVAVFGWLIYRRRYTDAVVWTAGVTLTAFVGYAVVWWREPLILAHIAALRHPVLEYPGAIKIVLHALTEPAAPIAAIGGALLPWKGVPDRLLIAGYCIVAWIVAILTIPQVGANVNYFWEPLLVSAVIAGPGLRELRLRATRIPAVALLSVLLLPTPLHDVYFSLKNDYVEASGFQARKARWRAFVSVISGRRLLSTVPDVTSQSSVPEIPDPFLNSMLERHGQWDPAPIVAQISAAKYDVVVVGKGEADVDIGISYRGIRVWNNEMWNALRRTYRRACVLDELEIWLPKGDSSDILPRLLAIGCLADSKKSDSSSAHP